MKRRTWLVLWLCLLHYAAVCAGPLPVAEVPPALKSWIPWALYNHQPHDCPFVYNQHPTPRCLWPSRLTLHLTAQGGTFAQHWVTFTEEWITLPGGAEHWPQDVQRNGQLVAVSARAGVPALLVPPGTHTVSGTFLWDTLPQALVIPATTGLVGLTLEGQTVEFPDLDQAGQLWLRRGGTEQEQAKDSLELRVYRRITDDIPLLVTVRIDLQVSGKQREVVLGPVLSADFIPMVLTSPLPARLEPDGRLRAQVRPGAWTIALQVRHTGARLTVLALPSGAEAPWPQDEIWAMELRPHLRHVEIDGVLPIDPQQTTLPHEWRTLPAYQLRAGDRMQLIEKRRGDPDPAPDQLALHRQWWLDFAGTGYTVQDQISGSMTRGWRLDLHAPATLGRVAVSGQEQFITTAEQQGRAGVELRHGRVQLVADSRLEGVRSALPAVGWEHDFHQVSGALHLPPGWRVLTAQGVDSIPEAWLELWTLMDFFLMLLLALSIGKLWGWPWGGVALVTLVLLAHEPNAPWSVWLHVLVAVAVLRVLPMGWLRRLVSLYRVVAVACLLFVAVSFMMQQARTGLHPQLERPWQVVSDVLPTGPQVEGRVDTLRRRDSKLQAQMEVDRAENTLRPVETPKPEAPASSMESFVDRLASTDSSLSARAPMSQRPQQYDPNAAIQTGPGLPRWEWTTVTLGWSGPVVRTQQLSLWLLPPWMNRVLAFVRLLGVAALLSCVLRLDASHDLWQRLRRAMMPLAAGATAAGVLLLTPPVVQAQDGFPPPEVLKELRTRLTHTDLPRCLPDCAISPRLQVDVSGQTLRLRQEIHTTTRVAVPLPGQARHWLPQSVLVDGTPAEGLARDTAGQLWLDLPAGRFQLVMEGPLPKRDTVELPLPLKPYRAEIRAEGWEVQGRHEDGLVDAQLQLRRARRPDETASSTTLESGTLPPFVRVERTLHLGLTWSVETRVLRVSPAGTAVLLEVPLLAGEAVTTPGVRVEQGKVAVNMAAGESEALWASVLETRAQLQLSAPDTLAWTEIWRLDVGPLWRMQPSGIPVVHHSHPSAGHWFPEWRPWPGEIVDMQITRPEGVAGATLTIDHSNISVTPGRRATDVEATLELRSSRGGQYSLTLPEHATLQQVSINGQTQAQRQENHVVTLPLHPGTQRVVLRWRQANGIATHFASPLVNAVLPSVNAHVRISMPQDRWVLWCSGPRLGPAVLFWSLLVIVVLGALVLGRLPLPPIRTPAWILLGIGLAPTMVETAFLVVGWLLALGLRQRLASETRPLLFNATQIGLVILTALALGALFFTLQAGLLGTPDMRIAGNGSHNLALHWYQDRAAADLPQASVWSLPLWVYRLAMLAWALWMVLALLRWLRWGWECFSTGGLWRQRVRKTAPPEPEAAARVGTEG